jgi:acyl carrier protein
MNSQTPSQESIESAIIEKLRDYCEVDGVALDALTPFENMTLDSILAVTIIQELKAEYQIGIRSTLFYEHANIREAAKALLLDIQNRIP